MLPAAAGASHADAPSAFAPLHAAVNQYPNEEMKRVLAEKIGLTAHSVAVSRGGRLGRVAGRHPPHS